MTSSRRAAAALAAAILSISPLAAAQLPGPAPAGEEAAAAPAPRRLHRLDPEEARPFFERRLPEPLLHAGPMGLLWWQWLALPVLVVLSLIAGWLLGWLSRRFLQHLAQRTRTPWDEALLARSAAPLLALWAIAVATALHPWLLLDPAAQGVLERILRAGTYLAVFWAAFRSVEVAFRALAEAPWTRLNAGAVGLLPIGRKLAKLLLLVMGAVAVLDELGFQVTSLLAGLGIGGIALALAAQKTVENLFGSVSIGVDQQFRLGDFVKVDETIGHVESIGMRSTRIRTLDRTLVTIPNGKLADMKSESYAARDRFRLLANLSLSYATTAAQMRAVIGGIRAVLAGHPKIAPGDVLVRFTEFKDWSLNLEVMAWFRTADWNEFCEVRTEVYLRFLEVVEQAGTAIALPTQTVRLETGAGERAGAAPGAGRPAAP
ncbi:MAG TPA: mechanosensitive ion channel family protein [Anaeromyxobacter sp.]|nr:mechanosensitive ion channel family protein [Anaeromyxobacter sp.]